jgi:hypothetical protein
VVTATTLAGDLGATVFDHTRVPGIDADADGVTVGPAPGTPRAHRTRHRFLAPDRPLAPWPADALAPA